MTWTTDRPTVPGWYWRRGPGLHRLCIVEIARDPGSGFLSLCDLEGESLMVSPVAWAGAEWAGPIPPPPAG